jgi:general secretion pathway protein D
MTHATSRFLLILGLAASLAGCATSKAIRDAQRAELAQDYDRAVVEYSKALREDPDNRLAMQALDAAKIRASLDHLTRGRRLAEAGRVEEAAMELQIAAELNPTSADIDDTLASIRLQLQTQLQGGREGKTELESLIERARNLPPAGQELPADIRLPATLTFAANVSSRDIFLSLARFANVTVVFDPQFQDRPVPALDVRGASFADALRAVSTATRNFYRVENQRTVTIIPDTPAKRREYEVEIARVFYLSDADLKETIDLLRVVADARRIQFVSATNAITVKDTPERVELVGEIIKAIDKARPEIVVDVELLEIDRTRLREFGLQLTSPNSSPPGISGTVGVDESLTLRGARSLTQSGVVLANLPALFYRLIKSDTNTRTLANPQLRMSEGQAASARFGERVPVPVTQFLPIATGGLNQQPITSYQYENIGVNIDVTPRTHHDDAMSLAVKVEVSSLSGTGFGGLPTFGNRAITTTIRLKDGETNMLAGLIRDDERSAGSGIPGLSSLPVVGALFGQKRRETQETDIILTLTPRLVRGLKLALDDLRPIRVRRDGESPAGSVVDLPAPPVTTPVDPPPGPQQPQPGTPPAQQPTPGPILVPIPPAPGK